jgi:arylsulfatase A-like enzyme
MTSPSRREFIRSLGAGACGLALSDRTAGVDARGKRPDRPPNVVLILMDDMGYADIGCYGALGYQTPAIDRIASDGLRFTSFYAAQAVCSASRAALLTGCYSERVGIQGALMPWATNGLGPSEQTLADLLRARGYATACFGKWHLGHHRPFLPLQHGFDEYLGLPYSNDMWPVDFDGRPATGGVKATYPPLPLIDGNDQVGVIRNLDDQATLTGRYTERALRFVDRNRNRPFFLYLPHSMVHIPIAASPAFRGRTRQGLYADMMTEVDDSVGRILGRLASLGLDQDTLVIFTSDNGPWLNFGRHAGSAGPLREGKGTAFEGGVRVPCVVRWPGRIRPGTTASQLAATMDLLPTIVAAAGAPEPRNRIDGVNLLPLLEGGADANPRRQFFYYYGRQLRGVRKDRWKLLLPHTSDSYSGQEPGRDGFPGRIVPVKIGLALYDLTSDIGESRDVAAEHPDVVAELQALAESARDDLGDTLTGRTGKGVREPGRLVPDGPRSVAHAAVGKAVRLARPPSPSFPGTGGATLVDGERGSYDFHDGKWIGFEGRDLEAVVDLGEEAAVARVGCGFLEAQVSWIFLPERVEIAVSADGGRFVTVGTVREALTPSAAPRVKDYAAAVPAGTRARFVRIRAGSVKTCPSWHAGAGGKAWLFADEIVVLLGGREESRPPDP